MRNVKRMLSFLLVVAMLACVPVATSAETEADLIDSEVLHSITMEDRTGLGLAFRIKMNIRGAQVNERNEFVNTDATATVDGVEYKVVKMGAVMANQAADIANMDNLTLADVTGRFVLDIQAKRLYDEPTADSCEYAVRITHLPEEVLGRAIGCRPYIVLEKDGVQSTIYGGGNICTYNTMYYEAAPAETPVLNATIADVDNRISVSDVTTAYVNYAPATYVEAFKVNFTLENVSANAKTSVGDTITYVCKDAEGNGSGDGDINEKELAQLYMTQGSKNEWREDSTIFKTNDSGKVCIDLRAVAYNGTPIHYYIDSIELYEVK